MTLFGLAALLAPVVGPTLVSLTGQILRRGPCDAEIGNQKAAPYS